MDYELTDFEWTVIQPLLPNKPRGVARVDDRRVLNGIFWVLRTGAPAPHRASRETGRYNRKKQPAFPVYSRASNRESVVAAE